MTFWQSQIALQNLVTGKVKATQGDHDHFIDKPSYPLWTTTSQRKHFTHSRHYTLRAPCFPAVMAHIPWDHPQNKPFLPVTAFARYSVIATSSALKVRNPAPWPESKSYSCQTKELSSLTQLPDFPLSFTVPNAVAQRNVGFFKVTLMPSMVVCTHSLSERKIMISRWLGATQHSQINLNP